jgi:hypothetical protein
MEINRHITRNPPEALFMLDGDRDRHPEPVNNSYVPIDRPL